MNESKKQEIHGVTVNPMTVSQTQKLLSSLYKYSDGIGNEQKQDILNMFLKNSTDAINFNNVDVEQLTTLELLEIWKLFAKLNPPFLFFDKLLNTIFNGSLIDLVAAFEKFEKFIEKNKPIKK